MCLNLAMIDSLPRRVKELREQLGLTQSELARRLDIKPQAIQALEAGKVKRPRFIVPLARELGVSPEFIEAGDSGRGPSIRRVYVRGSVQAGEWAEVWEWEKEDWYEVPVPAQRDIGNKALFAVETRGPSMNKRYPEGTILVCSDFYRDGEPFEIDRRYIVEVERLDGTVEATVKTLWEAEDKNLWLLPESTDPMFQTPIPLTGKEGETIRIVGRVRFSVIPE